MTNLLIETLDNSFFKEIIEGLSATIQKLAKFFGVNIEACLPRPLKVDFRQYLTIALLILVCWLLLIFEPVAMRMRTLIMHTLYPETGLQRAAWLYKQILRKRSKVLSFTNKQKRFSFHEGIPREDQARKSCWESFKRRFLR